MEYNTNPESLAKFIDDYRDHIQTNYLASIMPAKIQAQPPSFPIKIEHYKQPSPGAVVFEHYQAADLLRLLGDYHFKTGELHKTQQYLKESLYLNKKEAKTWLSYAKLNQ